MTVRTNSEKVLEDFNKVLCGEPSKLEVGKRKRRDEGDMGRDEGSCDEIPTSQPDEDMQYQNGAFENAKKRTKRVAELTVFPTKPKAKVIIVPDSGNESDPIDKFEDEFAAGASKRAQSTHSRHAYNSCNVSAKPNSVSKESDVCRRTYPEPSTSDDDELLMQYKPRKSPEASCKPLSSSSKSTKPPSSNSLPGPSLNTTGTSIYFTRQTREHERHDAREKQLASTMESSTTRAPLVMSPFALDLANDPPSTLNGRRADYSKPQPAHTDANKPAAKIRDQMRRAAPSGYPSKPFKPPGSSASASHHNNKPPSGSSSTKPTPTTSTRPNHPPQQRPDPAGTHSRSGPSRERATSPFETQQENAIQGLLGRLKESASIDADSHPPTTVSRPSAIRADSPFPETRSRTRQKRPPSPIDVDSYMIPEPDPGPSSSKPAPASTSSKPAPPPPTPPPASTPPPDDLPHKYQQLQKRLAQTTQQANQRLAEASRLQADAEARLERTQALLRTRTEELSVAQAFMVTADRVSVAEVVRAVEEVNDLMFQCAVDLADAVLDARVARTAKGIPSQTAGVNGKGKGRLTAREAVFKEWGVEVVRRLERDILDVDVGEESTVLFEAMVQNVLIEACAGVTKTLCFTDSTVDRHLKGVRERIQRTHEPSIAKNWLSMTANHASESTPTDHTIEVITRRLWNLVLLAGWQESSSSRTEAPIIADKVKTLMSKSLGIRKMVMQGVLSAEVEVVFPQKECWFDEACMTDTYALDSGGGSSRAGAKAKKAQGMGGTGKDTFKRAVCATALGITCSKPKAKAEGEGEKGAKAELVLKPKVLLYSTLEEGDA
ncbi:hypothetical protein D9611_003546 [Ephemerocybe angulata]|uniref:Uncharacterized protein n=1 Tax=Ephemerocybe angulata TaxID=980116 RepID=A0A8H5B6N4_9AGAR|nr:hypothetical protein D9611_003546 [Tulosesus angulatus]